MSAVDTAGWIDPIVSVLVVANVLPILPVVLQAVRPLPRARRRRTLLSALALGNVVALAFALGGGALLDAMGSGIDDVRVAGGIILLVFAVFDLLFSREERKEALGEIIEEERSEGSAQVGLVPLGMPMLVGPATLAATLFVAEVYGVVVTVVALLVNGLANAAMLVFGGGLMDVVGHGFVRATGKVFGLLLAALAVSMIRTGVTNMWTAG